MIHVASTSPYPWPYDGTIDPTSTALVLTGCDQVSAAGIVSDAAVLANIDRLRALAVEGVLVVLVSHLPPSSGLRGRRQQVAGYGNPIVLQPGDVEVTAAGLDGFYGSPLDAVLHTAGRTHLLIAGHGLETTVHSTLRRANDRGYECLLIADAASCVDPRLRAAAISQVEMSGGIFGAVGTTAAVLDAFARTT